MPAYSFKRQFVSAIKDGTKKQTIRKHRRGQAMVGNTIYLYYGMRTKYCSKIGEAVCTKVDQITILADADQRILVNGEGISYPKAERLAKLDGFESANEMFKFWEQNHTLPFEGEVIHWKKLVDKVAL